MLDPQTDPDIEDPEAVTTSSGPSPASTGTAAEVYVTAVASIPEISAGKSGWLPNDERTRSLLEREMIVAATPPDDVP